MSWADNALSDVLVDWSPVNGECSVCVFDAVEIERRVERLGDFEYEAVALTALHKLSCVSCIREACIARTRIASLQRLYPFMSPDAALCDNPYAAQDAQEMCVLVLPFTFTYQSFAELLPTLPGLIPKVARNLSAPKQTGYPSKLSDATSAARHASGECGAILRCCWVGYSKQPKASDASAAKDVRR
jgi:hypothetical protein